MFAFPMNSVFQVTSINPHLLLIMFVGDNFFKSVNYTIEVLCAASLKEEKDNLKTVEAQILSKRVDISKFESEYREVRSLTY